MDSNKKVGIISLIPKVAKKMGEKAASSVSLWWFNQPKVPESMKKQK